MKVKRQKHLRKTLIFYKSYFNICAPYRVLIDGTFCKSALKFKLNIGEQLPKYFETEVRLYTTPCIIAECQALGPLLYGPLKILQQYELHQCGHQEPLPAIHCIHKLARRQRKNNLKYIIATQDSELSDKLRNIAGIPLLYISHNAITLEAPSDKSKKSASGAEEGRIAPSSYQEETLKAIKKSVLGEEETTKKKKKKKIKGVNPLACKKKTKKPGTNSPKKEGAVGKKRKRKRNKKNRGGNIQEPTQIQSGHSSES